MYIFTQCTTQSAESGAQSYEHYIGITHKAELQMKIIVKLDAVVTNPVSLPYGITYKDAYNSNCLKCHLA